MCVYVYIRICLRADGRIGHLFNEYINWYVHWSTYLLTHWIICLIHVFTYHWNTFINTVRRQQYTIIYHWIQPEFIHKQFVYIHIPIHTIHKPLNTKHISFMCTPSVYYDLPSYNFIKHLRPWSLLTKLFTCWDI